MKPFVSEVNHPHQEFYHLNVLLYRAILEQKPDSHSLNPVSKSSKNHDSKILTMEVLGGPLVRTRINRFGNTFAYIRELGFQPSIHIALFPDKSSVITCQTPIHQKLS